MFLKNEETDLEDNLELLKNFVHKKTGTGPYSEEAVEAIKVKQHEAEKEKQIAADLAESRTAKTSGGGINIFR